MMRLASMFPRRPRGTDTRRRRTASSTGLSPRAAGREPSCGAPAPWPPSPAHPSRSPGPGDQLGENPLPVQAWSQIDKNCSSKWRSPLGQTSSGRPLTTSPSHSTRKPCGLPTPPAARPRIPHRQPLDGPSSGAMPLRRHASRARSSPWPPNAWFPARCAGEPALAQDLRQCSRGLSAAQVAPCRLNGRAPEGRRQQTATPEGPARTSALSGRYCFLKIT